MDFIKIKNKEERIYTINNGKNNEYLINFLARNNLLVSVTNELISFQVDNLVSLFIPLSEDLIKRFISDIGSQILYLKEKDIAISYFDIDDIIMINGNTFLFNNPKKLFKLTKKLLSGDKKKVGGESGKDSGNRVSEGGSRESESEGERRVSERESEREHGKSRVSERENEEEHGKSRVSEREHGVDIKNIVDAVDVFGELAEVMVGGSGGGSNKGDNLYGVIDYSSINLDNKFLPIEFKKKQEYNYYTTSFYSLAKLIQYIFNIKIENIYYTRLYYFLDRCLENIPKDRIFLYL